MLVPLWDANPLERIRFQYVTVTLIVINCAVFIMMKLAGSPLLTGAGGICSRSGGLFAPGGLQMVKTAGPFSVAEPLTFIA